MNDWDLSFGPSYTPMEMLDEGVFEGIYVHAIKDIPAKYYNHPHVVGKNEPDVRINKFGVKSRQSLKEWERKGWLTEHSPLGWFEWYIKYFEGRRIEEEDRYQIKRWRSFVARHQGQLEARCRIDDLECHPRQRQGLLQWGWDSTEKLTAARVAINAKRMAKLTGSKVAQEKLSKEKTTRIFLDDGCGFNLQDAFYEALAHGEKLAVVGGETDRVSDDEITYQPMSMLDHCLENYNVVFIDEQISPTLLKELSEKYDVVED